VEPHIESLPDFLQDGGTVMMGLQEAFDWADVIVTLVGHTQFKSIYFDHLGDKHIVDVAGIRKNEA
jgi:UDP-N-acetyl-D-mannosaminuronic acid dehydrogenase